jgi:hypothetical protein
MHRAARPLRLQLRVLAARSGVQLRVNAAWTAPHLLLSTVRPRLCTVACRRCDGGWVMGATSWSPGVAAWLED